MAKPKGFASLALGREPNCACQQVLGRNEEWTLINNLLAAQLASWPRARLVASPSTGLLLFDLS